MNVADFIAEIKDWAGQSPLLKPVILGVLSTLVSIGCFALGRVSGITSTVPPVQIAYCDTFIASSTDTEPIFKATPPSGQASAIPGGVLGSVHGTKWHYPWCSSAQTIKEENKIWFASEKEAEAAGYSKAGNCK